MHMLRLGFTADLQPTADNGVWCNNPSCASVALAGTVLSAEADLVHFRGDQRGPIIDQTAGSQIRISPLPGTPRSPL